VRYCREKTNEGWKFFREGTKPRTNEEGKGAIQENVALKRQEESIGKLERMTASLPLLARAVSCREGRSGDLSLSRKSIDPQESKREIGYNRSPRLKDKSEGRWNLRI